MKSIFPTIGPSRFLLSFIGAFQYIGSARSMVREGYTVYSGRIFRVPLFTHWTHVVSGRDRTRKIIQPDYTMGPDLRIYPWHVGVINSAFEDILSLDGTAWKPIPCYTAMMNVGCRTSNRLFLNIRYTIDVVIAGGRIVMLPSVLPIIGPLLTSRKKNVREAEQLLGPFVEKRLMDDGATSSHNDLISWLLDASPVERRTARTIVERVLAVNFAAIHTSSMAFTHTLFDLATYPQYITPLRLEVQHVVAEDGWTKAALGKMHKINSFLRESLRMNGLGVLVMPLKVGNARGFQSSDGPALPYGAFLEVAAMETHHDPALYNSPDTFDGFRFSRLRERDEQQLFKQHMVTTGTDYLPFGHGKHAFFAATELKAMLAYVVLNYDVKLDSADGTRPLDQSIASAWMPNRTAKVWFRRCFA
ncbi:cytochrome P450 [Mycena vulgaris]|nr:cytochrome P450 [Mycena vulgaris]